MIDPNEIFPRLAIARQAATEAGKILMEMRGSAAVDQKQTFNLVTEADHAAEELAVKIISENCPNDTFFREEGESTGTLDDSHLWIIDPLDGTNSYAHGIPQFSVSIAFASDGLVQLGVVFDPNRDELFWAMRPADDTPGVAFLNNSPIRVSQHASLTDCIISTGFYYERGEMMRNTLKAIDRLFQVPIRGIRRFGSAALDVCWVAVGRFDAHFEYRLSPWDYSAAWLILEQAGGAMFDRDGQPMQLASESVLATNGRICDELISIVRYDKLSTDN